MRWSVREYNELQIQEMERYKWIESEKAGRDLGEECLLDWIRRHGASFRNHFTNQFSQY
jgi:hypothetical protein